MVLQKPIYKVSENCDLIYLLKNKESAQVELNKALVEIIEDLKRLDEPQDEDEKVEVPDFVAELIRKYKAKKETLVCSISNLYRESDEYKWYVDNAEIYERAWVNGYEVEDEPRWIVCYSTMYLKSPLETGQIESVEITPKKELAYHFKSYKEAKQQTSLIGGAVEQVEV